MDSEVLLVLVVEDDEDDMRQFKRDLPTGFEGVEFAYDFIDDFEEARRHVRSRRYDFVISDTYAGDVQAGDSRGSMKLVEHYRAGRFCPIIMISSGTKPEGITVGPFLRWADKSDLEAIKREIEAVMITGIPLISRKIHDELDREAGSYLWSFVLDNWGDLKQYDRKVLERIVRRRAARQLADIDPGSDGERAETVEGAEFYLYPSISSNLSLGEIIRQVDTDEFFVVLTPHCYLAVQKGSVMPRADAILLAGTVSFREVLGQEELSPRENKRREQIRRMTGAAPEAGSPRGRYWYLPHFLEIDDLYCDFMNLRTVPAEDLLSEDSQYRRIAALAPPFAESLQGAFAAFYSSIGLPSLNLGSRSELWQQGEEE